MRNISSDILTALAGKELRGFLLFEATIDETPYRYTDCDVPIYYENMFYPRGMRVEPIQYSAQRIVDKMTIEIDDLDDTLKTPFIAGDAQGSPATMRAVVLDSDYAIIDDTCIIFFDGEIDDWDLDEETVQMNVVSQFIRWSQNTLSRHGASCRWKKFKGTYCGYSGASTWCDRTYTRCLALGNEDNFGGFRWLPSIAEKEIWWGRKFG